METPGPAYTENFFVFIIGIGNRIFLTVRESCGKLSGSRQCGIRAAETLNSPSGAVPPWLHKRTVRKITDFQ